MLKDWPLTPRGFFFILHVFSMPVLQSEIIEIDQIDAVRSYLRENTLCLFDVDDTLIDNPSQLGSLPWRRWIRPQVSSYPINFALFDGLTLYIAKKAPYKSVEPSTSQLIADLQNDGTLALAFTARGRSKWYSTPLKGVDQFTHQQLNRVGIDFKKTLMPQEIRSLDPFYFNEGIIFSQNTKKGDLFKQLFNDLNYRPSFIIFVDDKFEEVQSVDAVLSELKIPYVCLWYRRSENDFKDFNPVMANIQLEALLLTGEMISDDVAYNLAKARPNLDPQIHFREILEKIDLIQELLPALPAG